VKHYLHLFRKGGHLEPKHHVSSPGSPTSSWEKSTHVLHMTNYVYLLTHMHVHSHQHKDTHEHLQYARTQCMHAHIATRTCPPLLKKCQLLSISRYWLTFPLKFHILLYEHVHSNCLCTYCSLRYYSTNTGYCSLKNEPSKLYCKRGWKYQGTNACKWLHLDWLQYWSTNL